MPSSALRRSITRWPGHLLREVGLYPGQELLMMRLWGSGPQRQADLAAEIGTDSASTTPEQQAYALRSRCRMEDT
jgi:DNA-binding MarR family transcriptional regulator